ncbi:5-oxoprolinase subunit C family protein [Thermococcus waiotapuensis]|uniref:Biotin-dependent carboxyltransferase family protein n=1 Tax=Thermococcus waiotapuensis TaxID=90909 RepID=A0AAE4SY50_9EURY|nr:biotin-dependent carboxyltransferase family protein [Thermococcus waiotapuensis]MDV3103359.1 biotin-dependent carboxyltransferase family protein [Thermococcus waiotapuensis]
MIELLRVPSLLTVQDSGREGYRKLGVPVSGYMDDYSARIANYLVGNPGNSPLLEFLLAGPTLRFNASSVFAVAGDVDARLNGIPIEPWESHWAKRGDVLEVGTLRSGLYGYIAFAGGIKCERLLGSCSAYPKANLGRPLKAGDTLSLGYAVLTGREGRHLPGELRPDYSGNRREIRVVLGPNLEHFTGEGVETFLSETYTVTPESDRMGYRLDGPAIGHSSLGADIVTEPLMPGAVQVPADGRPIVMMRDAQTTGGYAKVATVISADLHLLAQSRPGTGVRFRAVTVEEALEILRGREKTLGAIEAFLKGEMRAYKVKAGGKEFTAFAGKVKY